MTKTQGNQIQDIILGELNKSSSTQEKLSDALRKQSEELIRLSGIKHSVSDLKQWQKEIDEWKDKFTEIASLKDIKDMKDDVKSLMDFKTRNDNLIKIGIWVISTALAVSGVLVMWLHK